jgi:hypothetical protein
MGAWCRRERLSASTKGGPHAGAKDPAKGRVHREVNMNLQRTANRGRVVVFPLLSPPRPALGGRRPPPDGRGGANFNRTHSQKRRNVSSRVRSVVRGGRHDTLH